MENVQLLKNIMEAYKDDISQLQEIMAIIRIAKREEESNPQKIVFGCN